MFTTLLTNLEYIGIAMAFLAITWASNFSFSVYHNVKLLNETFEKKRLLDGLYKLVAIVIGTALLAISITLIPTFFIRVGVSIPNDYAEIFNVLAIIGIYSKASYSYISQAYKTLENIVQFTSK